MLQKLFDRQADVFCNLSQQYWRGVTSGVKRHRRATTVAMTKLLMRTALPDFDESENQKY